VCWAERNAGYGDLAIGFLPKSSAPFTGNGLLKLGRVSVGADSPGPILAFREKKSAVPCRRAGCRFAYCHTVAGRPWEAWVARGYLRLAHLARLAHDPS